MPDNSENLNQAAEENGAAQQTPPENATGQETKTTNTNDLRDKLVNGVLQDDDAESMSIDFDTATPEERQAFFDNMPKISNVEIYKDLGIDEGSAFSELPQKLAEQKISPEQIKPVLDYYNEKVSELQAEQMDADDYDAKLHKYMGDDFAKYHEQTDTLFAKFVPEELRPDFANVPNNVMVAMKAVLTNVVKEYDAQFEKIKNDYGVDPNKYKIGSLKSNANMASKESRVKTLVNEIWNLNQKGDRAGAERKRMELNNLIGIKSDAED